MRAKQLLENAKNLHGNIANDVWPDGWDRICSICGKKTHLTTAECGYYLAHGWPKCDHEMRAVKQEGEK